MITNIGQSAKSFFLKKYTYVFGQRRRAQAFGKKHYETDQSKNCNKVTTKCDQNGTGKLQNKHESFEAHFAMNRLTSNNNLMTVLVGNETRTVAINSVRPELDKNNDFSTTVSYNRRGRN